MFVGSWAFALLAGILLGLGTILRNMKARNLKKRCRGLEESWEQTLRGVTELSGRKTVCNYTLQFTAQELDRQWGFRAES